MTVPLRTSVSISLPMQTNGPQVSDWVRYRSNQRYLIGIFDLTYLWWNRWPSGTMHHLSGWFCLFRLPSITKVITGERNYYGNRLKPVAEKCDCRRIRRLSPLSRRFRRQSPFSATVALFCDSVDRALRFYFILLFTAWWFDCRLCRRYKTLITS